jgi:regulatory protein
VKRFARRAPPTSPQDVRATAIRMLARRDYARAELEKRLALRGAPGDAIAVALDDLARLGLLSDARYAHALVSQMSGRYAKRAIEHRMREHGVDAEAVDSVGEEIRALDDADTARALVTRRFPEPPADDRERARQVRFLQSRGYPLSLILRIVRERERPSAER